MMPVVAALRGPGGPVPVSVDTAKAEVAPPALAPGRDRQRHHRAADDPEWPGGAPARPRRWSSCTCRATRDHAARTALQRRGGRGPRLPGRADARRGGGPRRRAPASRWTPGSASARRSSTTWSSCAALARSASSAGRSCSACRARASSARSPAARSATGSAGGIASTCSPCGAGADVFAFTTSASCARRSTPRRPCWGAGGGERTTAADGPQPATSNSDTFAPWKRTATRNRPSMSASFRGLSIYTHHGVTDAEQEIGQRLVIDVSFDVPDYATPCSPTGSRTRSTTPTYADIVVLAATERSYRTLQRPRAGVIGERLMERFGSDSVRVRAAKPEPPGAGGDRGDRRQGGPRGRAPRTSMERETPRARRERRIPGAGVERRRPARAPARCGRAARRPRGGGRRGLVGSTRPSPSGRSSTSPTS